MTLRRIAVVVGQYAVATIAMTAATLAITRWIIVGA